MQVATLPSEGLGLGGQTDSTAPSGPPLKYADLTGEREALLRAAYAAPRSRRENLDPNERQAPAHAASGTGKRHRQGAGRLRPWTADVGAEDWYQDPGNIFVPRKVFETVAGEVLALSERLEQLRVASNDDANAREMPKKGRKGAARAGGGTDSLESVLDIPDAPAKERLSCHPASVEEKRGGPVAEAGELEVVPAEKHKGEDNAEPTASAGLLPEGKAEVKGDEVGAEIGFESLAAYLGGDDAEADPTFGASGDFSSSLRGLVGDEEDEEEDEEEDKEDKEDEEDEEDEELQVGWQDVSDAEDR
eukprot:scaffold4097_cov306-Pinguiococcus_pyrenoidosus.AAC.17